MRQQLEQFRPSKKVLVVGGSVLGAYALTKLVWTLYSNYKRDQRRKAYPHNTVIVHQFPHKEFTPSLSAPCLKLETWLRFAEIKYENEFSYFERSSQGQIPYITLNGKDYHDSQFIIENLTQIFGKDLNDHLSQTEKGISRAIFKLVEESFKWALYYHRILVASPSDMGLPPALVYFMRPRVRKALDSQGYGRHTQEEVYKIGLQDLDALESFLGNKKYLFGDSPSTEDAVVFAYTAQVAYFDKGPYGKYLREKCPKLFDHFKNIKNVYWPELTQVV